ncbi:T9SS type A sorting domain-containing protein [Balneola sp. MJW-20]|uniref:T9SS type A sorting domain-containing protein n=1 Tax=Gracilimonas aurantiaca TaxID=3234185 RepID=UPI003466C8AB
MAVLIFSAGAYAQTVVQIADADLQENQEYTWTSDNVYLLTEMIFVKPGSVLNIEPGTVIQGVFGSGNSATGLVVTQGAKIYAEGTAEDPIIFTSEFDDGTLTELDRGLWGGVVILGYASTNNPTADGTKLVEGVNEIANPEAYARYGGTVDNDTSGVLRYVSIRHTGINVGDAAGNEIQGLTLGGVGSGTVIEYVESIASNDDGFEFFGGTVNTRYLVSAFNTDDAFDWDEGFRGKHQYWFAIQSPGNPDDGYGRAAEMDGATGDENTSPIARPVINNATYLGAGIDATNNAGDGEQLLIFRDNTGGEYYNSIFGDHAGLGISIESQGSVADFDSKTRLEEGDLILQNNLWWGFGAGNTITDFAADDGDDDQTHTRDYLSNAVNGNRVADPAFEGISRTAGSNGLDPRPSAGSPALDASAVKDLTDPFFDNNDYVGAFAPNNLWITGWTALDELGYVSQVSVSNEDEVGSDVPSSITLQQNYPNPFNPTTNISFSLPQAQKVTIKVYNMLGQEVATLANQQRFGAGSNQVVFDAADFSSGVYIYRLVSNNTTITRKMTLIK